MSEQLADVRKSIRLSPVNSPFPVINISLQELNIDNVQSANYNPPYSPGNELKGLTFDLNDTNQKNSIMKCLDLIERKAWVDNSND